MVTRQASTWITLQHKLQKWWSNKALHQSTVQYNTVQWWISWAPGTRRYCPVHSIVLIWHHQTYICSPKWNMASKVYTSKLISDIKVVVKQRQCLQDASFCLQGFEALTYHYKCPIADFPCACLPDPRVIVNFLYSKQKPWNLISKLALITAWHGQLFKCWNPNIHHCYHKNLDLDSIQNQSHMSIVSNSMTFHCSLYSSYPNWSCPAGLANPTTLLFGWFFHFQSSLVPLGSDIFT